MFPAKNLFWQKKKNKIYIRNYKLENAREAEKILWVLYTNNRRKTIQ